MKIRIGESRVYFVEAGDPVKTYKIQVVHWEDIDEIYFVSTGSRSLTMEQPELAVVLSELEKKGILRLEKGSLGRVMVLLDETASLPFIPKSGSEMQGWFRAATEALVKYLQGVCL